MDNDANTIERLGRDKTALQGQVGELQARIRNLEAQVIYEHNILLLWCIFLAILCLDALGCSDAWCILLLNQSIKIQIHITVYLLVCRPKSHLKEFVISDCIPIWIKITIHETILLIVYVLLTAADDSGAPADQCGGPDSGRAFPVQRAAAGDGGQAAGDAGARVHQDARGVHGPWPAHATQGGDWGPQGSPGGGGKEVRQAVGCRLGWRNWVGDSGVYAWVAVGCMLGWWWRGYGGIYAEWWWGVHRVVHDGGTLLRLNQNHLYMGWFAQLVEINCTGLEFCLLLHCLALVREGIFWVCKNSNYTPRRVWECVYCSHSVCRALVCRLIMIQVGWVNYQRFPISYVIGMKWKNVIYIKCRCATHSYKPINQHILVLCAL